MKNAPMLDFPVAEYEHRHRRLLQQMAQNNLDAAMFTTQYNVRYFTGFQSIVWVSKISTPGVLLVARDGRRRLIGSRSAYETMRHTSCMEDDELLHYGVAKDGTPRPASYAEAIAGTLAEFGAENGRLGMELGTNMRLHINQADFQRVFTALSNVQKVDFTPSIWAVRSVKSEAEVEAMRQCARISAAAYQKAFDSLVFGQSTERSLNVAYSAEAYRQGVERCEAMIVCFGQGRYDAGNCPPSDKPIERIPHAALQFDGGPIWRGYYSDTIRMGVVDGLAPRQRDYANMAQEALDFTLGNIKEGANTRELVEKQDGYIEKCGFGDVNRTKGWTGHGIGLEIHEPPMLSADSDWTLREGNVLAVEPCIGDDEWGHFSHEENIVVTKTGYKLISDFLPGVAVL